MFTGRARSDDESDLMSAVAPNHVFGHFMADVARLDLAFTALDLTRPPGTEPLEYESLRKRYLLEIPSVAAPNTAMCSTPSIPPPAFAAACG